MDLVCRNRARRVQPTGAWPNRGMIAVCGDHRRDAEIPLLVGGFGA